MLIPMIKKKILAKIQDAINLYINKIYHLVKIIIIIILYSKISSIKLNIKLYYYYAKYKEEI